MAPFVETELYKKLFEKIPKEEYKYVERLLIEKKERIDYIKYYISYDGVDVLGPI